MKVLVLLEVGADVRVPPDLDPSSGRVRADWLVRELDPASERALDVALELKADGLDVEVTALHLGPAEHGHWLRLALQRGADDAIRVWSEELGGAGAAGKAVVLAAAAQAAGFDLVLAGATGVLGGSGQLGVLVAEHLGVPCVTQAVGSSPRSRKRDARRSSGAWTAASASGSPRGCRSSSRCPPVPRLARRRPASPSAFARLRAQSREIRVWDLADLGVPLAQVRRAGRGAARRVRRVRRGPDCTPSPRRILRCRPSSAS